jgi:hypothetical protein
MVYETRKTSSLRLTTHCMMMYSVAQTEKCSNKSQDFWMLSSTNFTGDKFSGTTGRDKVSAKPPFVTPYQSS